MISGILAGRIARLLAVCGAFAVASFGIAQIPVGSMEGDAISELAANVMRTAELSIKTSDRTLSMIVWVIGGWLGGSVVAAVGLWLWLSRFAQHLQGEIRQAQTKANQLNENAAKTAADFEQVLRTLPILFIEGIDDESKIVALDTLAQLRRAELVPIFRTLLRSSDTRTQGAGVYALGLVGRGASESINDILRLSVHPDFMLRRECARALSAIDILKREVRMRLEEMTRDQDDIVKDLAQRGLEGRL